MKAIVCICFLTGLISCNQPSAGTTETAGTTAEKETVHSKAQPNIGTNTKPFLLSGCYQMTIKQDTADLQLTVQDTMVTGHLRYDWHERDGNTGTIKGVLRDSLIWADYTFESEGLTSVREVIFKIRDQMLLQAEGPLEERNGKIVFRNLDSLSFMTDYPFVKTGCR